MLKLATTLLPTGSGGAKPAWAVRQIRCPRCRIKCWAGKEDLNLIQKYGFNDQTVLCTICAIRESGK